LNKRNKLPESRTKLVHIGKELINLNAPFCYFIVAALFLNIDNVVKGNSYKLLVISFILGEYGILPSLPAFI